MSKKLVNLLTEPDTERKVYKPKEKPTKSKPKHPALRRRVKR